ncbi:MmcQ/YjbR family DNA-binding protein [Zhouia sp. PK063]|uniref:MmcQ/YjbR family DNA-binding protein n=1 Tax=Zhouia sp. PK063 TaxID=3373602 RepID=UPI0037AFAC95
MNIEQVRDFCMSKKLVTEHFPFDEDTLVFKVAGKMFALTSLQNWEAGNPAINLKCEPDVALEYRATYEGIQPGYHMNKQHWNTVSINTSDVSDTFVFEMIETSYQLIVKSLPKKIREQF